MYKRNKYFTVTSNVQVFECSANTLDFSFHTTSPWHLNTLGPKNTIMEN